MSLGDMSGPLCGTPDGATINAQVATSSAASIGELQNKTHLRHRGDRHTRIPGMVTGLVSE